MGNDRELKRLFDLVQNLKKCASDRERIETLGRDPRVRAWQDAPSPLRTFSSTLSPECELIIKSLVALGQQEPLMTPAGEPLQLSDKLRRMLEDLFPVEAFYKGIGGLIGYHWTMLSCMAEAKRDLPSSGSSTVYHRPPGIDISEETESVRSYILQGILSLPELAEMYPVGGAADRLRFCDPQNGQPLPAAKLQFCGRTLLEGLIRDLTAREYLYFKLFGEQIVTPIAMMTSSEKDNHAHILELCEREAWFGRPKDSFRFFCQPVVPTMDSEGNWCQVGSMKLLMKPGGHGVIWKVAEEEGIFDWMQNLGRRKLLVRQINNPVAGTDYGLLAFTGIGFQEDKVFGFASCPRQVESAEGVNILIEKRVGSESHYCLTNIEYCDFPKFSIEDVPVQLGSSYSRYPSNTNILFADIAAIRQAVMHCPIPGMLVNLKKMAFADETGAVQEREVARLESTMQNIADCFEQRVDRALAVEEVSLKTYLTYNHRRKTISTTKKHYLPNASLLETPEGCFYDQLLNSYDLLAHHCGAALPKVPSIEDYVVKGPSFLFSCHPALGPLYSIIGQKLRGLKLCRHSELSLEIAEADLENLDLCGSLHIAAERVVPEKVGSCRLKNVSVQNRGYNPYAENSYWKNCIERFELCEIYLHGHSEFVAENVVLKGTMRIEVESGVRMTAYEENGQLLFKKESLGGRQRDWIYHLSDDGSILLEK